MTNHFYTSHIDDNELTDRNDTLCLSDNNRYNEMYKDHNKNPHFAEKCYYKSGCNDCKNDCKIQGYGGL